MESKTLSSSNNSIPIPNNYINTPYNYNYNFFCVHCQSYRKVEHISFYEGNHAELDDVYYKCIFCGLLSINPQIKIASS
jgi:hypothetical protein